MLVGSKFGGMDIEAVAEENPDAIIKVSFLHSFFDHIFFSFLFFFNFFFLLYI